MTLEGYAMKTIQITPHMFTMSDVFYPKGYAFVMFPNAQDAEQVAQELNAGMAENGELLLMKPQAVLRDIGKLAAEESQSDIPSIGTEAATALKYINLARQGHHALMVRVDSDAEAEQVMRAVRKVPFSYAQRYHLLAIEDLV
jgi:hypothetical protein